MKNFSTKLLVVGSVVFGLMATSQAYALDSSTERKLVKICKAIQSDSKLQLHKAIKQSRLGYRQVAQGLVCNGKSAMEFAYYHNANNAAGLLARKANIKNSAMLAKVNSDEVSSDGSK